MRTTHASQTDHPESLRPYAVRLATSADLEAITAIHNQAIGDGRRTAELQPVSIEERIGWFEAHSPDLHPIYVAACGPEVLGYLSIGPYRQGRQALRHTCEVSYYVDYRHHRQGVATELVRHAMAQCPRLGIKTLFAIVLDCNHASLGFLDQRGFSRWGHLPGVAEIDGQEHGHVYLGIRIP